MWWEFQQVSGVLWIMAMPQGKGLPLAENGFITFRRLWTASFAGPGARTCPNLTATIAWRLTPNNRARRQTHLRNTAAEHKTFPAQL